MCFDFCDTCDVVNKYGYLVSEGFCKVYNLWNYREAGSYCVAVIILPLR